MRASVMGSPVDILTMSETVDIARKSMRDAIPTQHVALNVAKLVNMRTDPVLAADVSSSDIIGIDGMGIIVALKLLRIDAKERVTGIDLFVNLMSVCEAEGFRPYLLGATEEVLQTAVATLRKQHPMLKLAGFHNGHFPADQEPAIVDEIRASGANCLFIGMPTPRKERFLARYRETINVPFIMGVGGTFDVVAGHVNRAPQIMQTMGMEWLYRVYQEPGRLWWRYARTNAKFAFLLLRELLFHDISMPHNKPNLG